jgi:hypothetical protein
MVSQVFMIFECQRLFSTGNAMGKNTSNHARISGFFSLPDSRRNWKESFAGSRRSELPGRDQSLRIETAGGSSPQAGGRQRATNENEELAGAG